MLFRAHFDGAGRDRELGKQWKGRLRATGDIESKTAQEGIQSGAFGEGNGEARLMANGGQRCLHVLGEVWTLERCQNNWEMKGNGDGDISRVVVWETERAEAS
eukprot:GFKZ01004382.1.p2 GENE.GFKZ01004382.1~~GFKZ01004382.1.p2  ORF type:complete len:103 (-),score=19.49 GFKZ01004382.1:579-887(-)